MYAFRDEHEEEKDRILCAITSDNPREVTQAQEDAHACLLSLEWPIRTDERGNEYFFHFSDLPISSRRDIIFANNLVKMFVDDSLTLGIVISSSWSTDMPPFSSFGELICVYIDIVNASNLLKRENRVCRQSFMREPVKTKPKYKSWRL